MDAPGQAGCLAGCVCACACWGDNALRGRRRGARGSTRPGRWRRNLQMGTRVSLRSLAGRRGPGPEPSLQSRDTRWGEGGSRVSRRDGVWPGEDQSWSSAGGTGGGSERLAWPGTQEPPRLRGTCPSPSPGPRSGGRSLLGSSLPGDVERSGATDPCGVSAGEDGVRGGWRYPSPAERRG